MKKIRRILRAIDQINIKLTWIGCFLLAALGVLVPFEVLMRYVFNSPTMWSMELTQYMFLAIIAIGGGYVQQCGWHVNVDIVYERFGIRKKAIANIFTFLFLFVFLYVTFKYTVMDALSSLSMRETSATGWNPPIYPIKFIVPLGALLLLLQCIAGFIRYIIQAITGITEVKEDALTLEESFDK